MGTLNDFKMWYLQKKNTIRMWINLIATFLSIIAGILIIYMEKYKK